MRQRTGTVKLLNAMIRSKGLQFIIRVALYCLPALASLRLDIVSDPDIWWHTRTGQWIVQHGTVPLTDPFSTFGAGKTWLAYSWAFDVLLYSLQHKFGLLGYVVYVAAVTFAIAVALFNLVERLEPRFIYAAAITAVGLFALVPMYTPRSWLITILFVLLLLNILVIARTGKRKLLLLLPPLFFIWANIHIQFVYGLVILGFACVEPFVLQYLAKHPANPRRWDLPKLWLACVLATFVNPYGIWLYRTIAVYARQHPDQIQEMQPLQFRSISDWVFLVTILLAVYLLGRRRQLRIFLMLFLAFGAYTAFKSGRDIWVALSAALLILADSQPELSFRRVRIPIAAVCLGAVAIFAIGSLRHVTQDQLQGFVAKQFPVQAVSVVSRKHYAGPLYNDYDWGGYLIWELPEIPVVIDGRMDVQGDAHFKENWTTWMAGPEWSTDRELRRANLVIANRKLPLTSVLRLDPEFEIVHEDDVAIVFVRRSAVNATVDHPVTGALAGGG